MTKRRPPDIRDADAELQDRVLFALSECRDALIVVWRKSIAEAAPAQRQLRIERALNRAKLALSQAQEAGWELPSLEEAIDDEAAA